MRVVELRIKDISGDIKTCKEIFVDNNLGIVEEFAKRSENRQVSLLGERSRKLIDKEELEGLCLYRFYENITIEGLDAETLALEDRLQIGQTVQEVVSLGKRCFDECKLVEAGEKCELFSQAVFTKVIKGGTVKLNDGVSLLER